MEATTKLYSFNLLNTRTYLFAALFITGNVVMPQLCHLIPQGGLIFLPIYFFTLVGAYKYGIGVGLITAVLSPLVNNALFGMPAAPVLPAIIIKSIILATAASLMAYRAKKVSLIALTIVVLSYQIAGSAIEWLMGTNIEVALQDFRLGIPGMVLQIFGVYAIIKYLIKK